MKPRMLRLQNFGPYVDQEIDFERFTHQALFLITGKTGSGKSTLFDAMCYALYGQTSGNLRSAEQMRSEFAKPTQPTSVYFTFEHQQKLYEITRMPAQVLQSKRQDKTVSKSSSVCLRYQKDDGTQVELTKMREVQDFITNLLKLKAEQFVQTILLPQGKFQTFLLADSNKKEEVLRDLFGTTLFNLWGQKVQERAKKEQGDVQKLNEQINQIKQQITNLDSTKTNEEWLQDFTVYLDELKQKAADLQVKMQQKNDLVEQLAKELQKQESLSAEFKRLDEATFKLEKLEAKKAQMDALSDEVNQLEWVQKNLIILKKWQDSQAKSLMLADKETNLTNDLQVIQKKQQQTQSDLAKLEQQDTKMKDLAQEIQELTTSLAVFEQLELLLEQLAAQMQAQTKIAQKVKLANEKQAMLSQQQQDLSERYEKLENLEELKLKLQANAAKLTEFANDQKQLHKLADNKDKLYQEVSTAQKTIDAKQKEVTALNAQLKKEQNDVIMHQITQLAAKLKPGTPCPLCGSTHHPNLASLDMTKQVLSQEQLDALSQKAEKQSSLLNNMLGVQQQRTTQLHALQEELTQTLTVTFAKWQLVQTPSLTTFDNFYQALVKRQEKDEKYFETQSAQKEEMAQKLNYLTDELKKAEQALKEQQDNYQQVTEQCNILQARKQEQQKHVPKQYENTAQLRTDLTAKQQVLQDYKAELTKVKEQEYQQAIELGRLQGLKVELSQQIQAEKQILQQARQDLAALFATDAKVKDYQQMQLLSTKLDQLNAKRQQVNDFYLNYQLAKQIIEQANELLATKQRPNLDQTKAQLQAAKLAQEAINKETMLAQANYQNNQNAQVQILKLLKENAAKQELTMQYMQLSETMSGKNPLKLSFERYVLRQRFIEVLRLANQRLNQLTYGRYALCLDNQKGRAQSSTGLELDIYDGNIGTIRSVKTLSGGESFIAALCLALALGEVIQNEAGGVQIDALFIDEGFGSLDSDALDVALNVLQTIEGKNKMIGIISHVQELRERIPAKLIITNKNGKSQVSYQEIN